MPHLLKDRTNGQEAVIVVVIPLLFGAVTGWALGVSEPLYLVLLLLGILGGLVAGMEHEYALEGFYRGLLGGLLFGLGILLAHGIIDTESKGHLPDPEVLLIAINAAFGAGLGALGGRIRDKRTAKERAAAEPRYSRDGATSEKDADELAGRR
jgi:hypothetical protein